MRTNRKTWFYLVLFSFISFLIWFKFTYPQFSFIDQSIDRAEALRVAQEYLIQEEEVDPSEFKHATVFIGSRVADQYLQKAIGFEEELNFFDEHDFELFFWKVRFFQENEKEEYYVSVSAATGEITSFTHIIPDTDYRKDLTKDIAQAKVLEFLKEKFNFNLDEYFFHSDIAKKRDNRIDYTFMWAKKDVLVKWSDQADSGGAKLLTMATISGDEILFYNKSSLKIPDSFKRFIAQEREVGRNLSVLFRIIFFIMLSTAIFYVVVRRNDLVMHMTKKFSIVLTGILFLTLFLARCNSFENILYNYPTTASFSAYLMRYFIKILMDIFVVTITVLMPCLAGESLHYEMFPDRKEGSFLHYIRSTIFSRSVFKAIIIGYFVAMIMIGIQSAAFEIGIRHFGVWLEHTWMGDLSASYIPFLAALVVGLTASFSEEIAFRIFSISFGKKLFKSTIVAVILSSLIWGYGHSAYLIFPMWFRGLEVTLLGLFLAFIYLRYGIISVLVAHYVFDVFWNTSAFLLGESDAFQFQSSIVILLLPLIIGVIAYFKNKPETERAMNWKLNKHQLFNLEILKHSLANMTIAKNKTKEELKKEIVAHGWDIAVVEMAVDNLEDK